MSDKKGEENEEAEKKATSSRAEPYFEDRKRLCRVGFVGAIVGFVIAIVVVVASVALFAAAQISVVIRGVVVGGVGGAIGAIFEAIVAAAQISVVIRGVVVGGGVGVAIGAIFEAIVFVVASVALFAAAQISVVIRGVVVGVVGVAIGAIFEAIVLFAVFVAVSVASSRPSRSSRYCTATVIALLAIVVIILMFVIPLNKKQPLIKKQPSNISIAERSDVSFKVRADGMDLVYKWYKNGTSLSNKINIEGSNLATLRIYNVSVESSGKYSCTISGGGHSVNSTVAVLTVYKGIQVTEIQVTNSSQFFDWKGYGLRLNIPPGSLPSNLSSCTITIIASLSGHYVFPVNTELVSPVFWFRSNPKCKFQVQLSLEIQHCAPRKNSFRLSFARASHTTYLQPSSSNTKEDLPVSFNIIHGGTFNEHTTYGMITLNQFCRIAVVENGSDERVYWFGVFYMGKHTNKDIHFAVTWSDDAHVKTVRKQYSSKKAATGPEQSFYFRDNKINLSIEREGVTLQEKWKIFPSVLPEIDKKRVDLHKPESQVVPHCELVAKWIKEGQKVQPLEYIVEIYGTLNNNFFTINIDPGKRSLIDEQPLTEANRHHQSSQFPHTATTTASRTTIITIVIILLVAIISAIFMPKWMPATTIITIVIALLAIFMPKWMPGAADLKVYPSSQGGMSTSECLKPTMPCLLNFPGLKRNINIPNKIGADYTSFGISLLKDETGAHVKAIQKELRGVPVDITTRILNNWLEGKGVEVSWKSLVKVLNDIGLKTLAEEINETIRDWYF